METTSQPAVDTGFDTAWEYLEQEIGLIMTHHTDISYAKYESLHTFVLNYCTSSPRVGLDEQTSPRSMACDLYNKLSHYLVLYLNEIRRTSETILNQDILHFYAREWDRYTIGASYVHRVFTPLNHWIKRERKEGKVTVYPVYTLALSQWRLNVFHHLQRHSRLVLSLLKVIESQRNGETIDQVLIRKIIDSFVCLGEVDGVDINNVSLGLYVEHFEGPFIAATEKYYRNESATFLEQNSLSDYLKRIEARLREEEYRSNTYLHANTRKILIDKCEDVLIRQYSEKMWDHLERFLDEENQEDLQRVCSLLGRIPESINILQDMFEKHVRGAGQLAVSKLVREDNTNAVEARVYVATLLEVYQKYHTIVQRSFKNETTLLQALDRACRNFVNHNAVTETTDSCRLLARHASNLLKSNRSCEECELESALDQVMILLKYINDKDIFETFYASKLARRLIYNVSASESHEARMISRLKDVCDLKYILKLQRMLNDMQSSKGLTDQFLEHSGGASGSIDFGVLVLSTNIWPLEPPRSIPDFIIPSEIQPVYQRFTQYHKNRYSGRRLTWLWNYSRNELYTNYLDRQYILMTSPYQMAILLQYNRHDTLSLEELVAATGIPKDLLMQILPVLVTAKLLTNEETDQYYLSSSFKAKKIRVNINVFLEAGAEVPVRPFTGDRRYELQATIVRIMKVRLTMTHLALVAQVLCQISMHFTPKIAEIKVAIEILLEKEYIERIEGQRGTYKYIA